MAAGPVPPGAPGSRASRAALRTLARAGIDITAAAAALGRTPTSVAHRARDTGLRLPQSWRAVLEGT
jgi:hypothetical protein